MNPTLGVIFNMLGFAIGGAVYFYEAKRRNLNLSQTNEVALIGVLVGVVAGWLGQSVFSLGTGSSPGGRTIIAGVLGGWLGVEIAKRRYGIKVSTGPLWAVALPAGESIGRIGCWFHGCCYGRECDLPWAVFQHDAARYPTQFLLSGSALITFLAAWWYRDRGDVFALSLFLWSVSRMLIEPFRESSVSSPWLVPAICAAVAVYALRRLVKSWNPKTA
ncbi:MAG: prolipoprotein diacylglyceryl transferase [Fimbriimonas sp.]